jgi:catechol 2,3-dioxygenase-like lactoylglutathione lyase family enzyme
MIQTYGLSHIQIAVRDLEKSVKFYQDLFGMKEILRPSSTFIMLQTPGSSEVFTINSDPKVNKDAGKLAGVQHFGFRLRERMDMNELGARVIAAGGTSFEHGTRGEKETWAFFNDPDGYDIEIFWSEEH